MKYVRAIVMNPPAHKTHPQDRQAKGLLLSEHSEKDRQYVRLVDELGS